MSVREEKCKKVFTICRNRKKISMLNIQQIQNVIDRLKRIESRRKEGKKEERDDENYSNLDIFLLLIKFFFLS